jgi:hypothetical protein
LALGSSPASTRGWGVRDRDERDPGSRFGTQKAFSI